MSVQEVQFYPKSQSDWRKWLVANHKTSQSVWLIFYKKNSGKANLSWSEAVDEALCYGWIDSKKKTIDDEKYMQYFSQRKPKSIWSKVNKLKVEKLIKESLMTQAGLDTIIIAKQNGSWTILDTIEELIIPKDLETAFKTKAGAKKYFLSLSKSIKKQLLYWIISAKRKETREKRIGKIVESAGLQQLPKQFR